jgi:hypothetical protein
VYALTISAANAPSSLTTQAFTLTVDQAPAITSAAGATFTLGSAGSFTVTTTGYPMAALSESGKLPGGVAFVDNHNGTATLSGTPTATGVCTLTVDAANGVSPAAAQTFTLAVDKAPAITSAAGASFTVGKCGTFTITTTPGVPATTTLSESGKLPCGVSFKAGCNGTATLSGTPAAGSGGVYALTISAGNAPSSLTTQAFTLTVDQAQAITSAAGATFTLGSAGSFTVTTTGYPVAALSESGKLPGGVAFVDNRNGTATLSGTPAASSGGTYSFSIIAGNGVSPEAIQVFSLRVAAKCATTRDTDPLAAATHDAALMAVLADSNDDTTGVGTKKERSVSAR